MLLLLLSRFSRVRLCDPIDGSPGGSHVPGILQARTLEWAAYMSYPLILSPSVHFCPSYLVFSEFSPILLFFLLSFPFLSLCFSLFL